MIRRGIYKKISNYFYLTAVAIAFTTEAKAAIVDITGTSTKPASDFTAGDTANFTGNGTLNVDVAKTLDSITAATTNNGTINFSTANTLTVSNNIGSSSNTLAATTFSSDGALQLGGSLYMGSSGITTTTTGQGSLTLTGSSSQTISSILGSSSLKLKTLSINQDVGAVFNGTVYANTLSTATNSGTLAISGTGGLNFTTSGFNVSTTISSTGAVSLGTVTLANSKTLTLSTDASFSSLASGDSSSTVSIASGKTMTVTGDITGTGIAKGASSGVGNVAFTGTSAQAVSSTYKLGDGSNRLGTLTVSNTSGVTLNNDAYASAVTFNQSSGASTLSVASGKILNVTGNIAKSSSGSSVIKGAGTVYLSGSSAQTVSAGLGASTSDRLGELKISNTAGATLSGDSYVTTLTANADTTITASGTLNASNSAINYDIFINGSGTISLGTVTLANSKTLTLGTDASFSSLASGDSSSTVSIASGKTMTVTGDITGTGIAKGASSGVGNIAFTGTSAQSVSSTYKLGDGSNRLGTVTVSNTSGVTLNNDAYASAVTFGQSSGTSTLSVVSGKTLNVTGNIAKSSSGSSVIKGAGTVYLSGSSAQTVSAGLGASTSDRLGELKIDNAAGVTLSGNNYLTALTLTNGSFAIGGDAVTDVTNAVNLSGKTMGIQVGGSATPFGKIKSAAGITVNGSTTINIDYSATTASLSYGSGTQYTIAESGTGISGAIGSVAVTDTSYLFNNSLAISGNNIVTTLDVDSGAFGTSNLGNANYNLILGALDQSSLSAGVISISTKKQLTDAVQSLKPMSNAAQASSVIAANSNIINIVNSHSKEAKTVSPNSLNSVWGRTFGSVTDQRSREDTLGYMETSGGLVFGVDTTLSSIATFGAALGYTKGNINGDVISNHHVSIDNYQLVLYNNNSGKKGLGFYNDNAANFTINSYKTNRDIRVGTFESRATGDFSGTSQTGRIGFGYNAKIFDKFFIDPNFAAEYFSISQDDYQEKGAGNANLKVKTKTMSGYFSEVGLNFGAESKYENYLLTPKFSVNWRRSLDDYRQKSTISFVGGSRNINNDSIAIQKDIVSLGLGMNVSGIDDSFLQLKWDMRFARKLVGGIVSANYVLPY